MATRGDERLDGALRLSAEERVDFARRPSLTLNDGNESLSDAEWVAAGRPELERRVQAYKRGETVATDWRDSLERVRKSLTERNQP